MKNINPDYTEFAKKAYEAYGKTTDFKNYQGLPMPPWNDLPDLIKKAWVAATKNTFEQTILFVNSINGN